jgi:excisionase family DNA binding protein
MMVERRKPIDPTAPPPIRLVTVGEAARFLRLARQTVYTMRSQGRLPAMRVGGRAVFSLTELEAFVEREGRGLVGK